MRRSIYMLCVGCALAVMSACEGTETGNPDPSHGRNDAGFEEHDGGAEHHADASLPPPRDAGAAHDGGAQDAGAEDEDAGPADQDAGR